MRVDREAYDVADRLAGLGPERKARPRPLPGGAHGRHRSSLTGAAPQGAVVGVVTGATVVGVVVGGVAVVVVVVVVVAGGGGPGPEEGPSTVTRVPIGVKGQSMPALATHLDAAVALGKPVMGPYKAVQGVTTVEEAGPGHRRVVVLGPVGIRPLHDRGCHVFEDGVGAVGRIGARVRRC
jgi:hypothetical protein